MSFVISKAVPVSPSEKDHDCLGESMLLFSIMDCRTLLKIGDIIAKTIPTRITLRILVSFILRWLTNQAKVGRIVIKIKERLPKPKK
ncbi:hypothetical protein YDYSY3_15230 [Paenibacillus chitinolyticus]|nr:hypothetical protein YDYSY3_15230 [Paenibacillus chitinolyticus]